MSPASQRHSAAQGYGVRDVERLLRLPRSTIRALVGAGFVTPERGPRGVWRFSFQDLIVLRTAQALAQANVPPRRITRSVRELRRHLPEALPLSGLSICAVADRVVVREAGSRWQAESGQYLLDFELDAANGTLSVIERAGPPAPTKDAQQWFDEAAALERRDVEAALAAYGHAVALDPSFVEAHINRGRLLHTAGRLAEAERAYREGIARCGGDPVLYYNLGVLFEDAGHSAAAVTAYEAAVRGDPDLADGHYNLALLYERLRRPKDAIRHMARYRLLTSQRPK